MGKWVTNYIRDVSDFLSRIAGYRDKNIELHLQAQRELLPLLFALHHQPKLLKVPEVSLLQVTIS